MAILQATDEFNSLVIMTRKLPPLTALRVFEAAARRLSFKEAAAELHVTPTAVSHQIRQLEEWLGLALFERGTRRVRLTAAGERLLPPLRDGFDSFERAFMALRQGNDKVARLSSTVAFTARRLAMRAGSFREAYPDWGLRLDATNQVVDLDFDADAAIRYGSGVYPELVVEPLFRDRFAPVCRPHIAPLSRRELGKATLIHFEWGPAFRGNDRAPVWRHWLERKGWRGIDAFPGLAFTDEIHAIQATIAGQGIGLLSLAMVADELASGILVTPFDLSLESFHYDFVCSPRMTDQPAATVLRDWVTQEFGKHKARH